jgi:5-formyltetrahydrofolate cyclo-ligase
LLRARLLAARAARAASEREAAGAAFAEAVLARPETLSADTIAVYAAIGSEPPTRALVGGLAARGVRLLLPVLRPDGELDWAAYDGRIVPGRRGLSEPPGTRLGVDALATADVAVVPALALDARGVRLGRGGGAYDRALARVPDLGAWAMVYDDELLEALPAEPHDRPVAAAITPSGWRPLGK